MQRWGCKIAKPSSYLYAGFPHLPKYLTRFFPLRRLRARVDAARVAIYIRGEPITLHILHPRKRLSPPSYIVRTRLDEGDTRS